MTKDSWQPHVKYAASVACGLFVFHLLAYLVGLFPTSFGEVLILSVPLFLVPCLITSLLYSMVLRWCFPLFLRAFFPSRVFALSGLIQGMIVYPVSVQISAIPLGGVLVRENLVGAVVLSNVVSLILPIVLALAYGRAKRGDFANSKRS
jgi:hypothetical protein